MPIPAVRRYAIVTHLPRTAIDFPTLRRVQIVTLERIAQFRYAPLVDHNLIAVDQSHGDRVVPIEGLEATLLAQLVAFELTLNAHVFISMS